MSKNIIPKIQQILGINYNWDQFPINQYESQVYAGSMGINDLIHKIVASYKPKIIIEIGSWLGHSAIEGFGKSIKNNNLDCAIICVDTWLGSNFGSNDALKRLWGYPTMYYQFLANIMLEKCDDIIMPIPMSSVDAGSVLINVFNTLNIKADLIYIDGSHLPDSVCADCSMYFELLSENGLMFGDDWVDPHVKLGVNMFIEKNKDAHLIIHPRWEYTWFIYKGNIDDYEFFKQYEFFLR